MEERSIGEVTRRTLGYVDFVVVVDDGSTDMTADSARQAGALVVRHERNLGKGRALRTGFSFVAQSNPNILVTLDADGQHPPDQIPLIIEPIVMGDADLVIGTRLRAKNVMPTVRRLSNGISTFLVRLVSGLPTQTCTDSQCGFRAFSPRMFSILRNLKSDRYNIESETLVLAARSGLRIKEIPITCAYSARMGSKIKVSREIPLFLGLIIRFSLETFRHRKLKADT